MSDDVQPEVWTRALLRKRILDETPWHAGQQLSLRTLIEVLWNRARALVNAPQSKASLLGSLKAPDDFIRTMESLGHQRWLREPGANVWSHAAYSSEVLDLAFGTDQKRRTDKRGVPQRNHRTETGIPLFEEFTDLFFDLGLPVTQVIDLVRKHAPSEIFGPGNLSFRSVIRKGCFSASGAAGIAAEIEKNLGSREEAWNLVVNPFQVLPMDDIYPIFLPCVFRKLEELSQSTEISKSAAQASTMLEELKTRFPDVTDSSPRVRRVPKATPVADMSGYDGDRLARYRVRNRDTLRPHEFVSLVGSEVVEHRGVEDGGKQNRIAVLAVLRRWAEDLKTSDATPSDSGTAISGSLNQDEQRVESRSPRASIDVAITTIQAAEAIRPGDWVQTLNRVAEEYIRDHPDLAGIVAADLRDDAQDQVENAVLEVGLQMLRDQESTGSE